MSLISKLLGLLGLTLAGSASSAEPVPRAPAPVYLGLRTQALCATAESLGVKDAVFGVVMEMGYPEAVVTLVAMADGAASLYFSNGGGMIGAGQHPGPATAARSLIAFASHNVEKLKLTQDKPLPGPGRVRFYVLTTAGVLSAEASESDLGENRHVLSPLFYSAQELITEMRNVEENRK